MVTQLLSFSADEQADGEKIIDCRMQQICNISPLMRPPERDYHQALKSYIARCNRVATDRPSEIKAIITGVLQVGVQRTTAPGGGRLKLIIIRNRTLEFS